MLEVKTPTPCVSLPSIAKSCKTHVYAHLGAVDVHVVPDRKLASGIST